MNFYFIFVYYAPFYDFSKYIENSKIVKPKKKYLGRYMGDAPPSSWILSWSFLKSLSSFQKLFSSCSGCSSGSEKCTSDGWLYS